MESSENGVPCSEMKPLSINIGGGTLTIAPNCRHRILIKYDCDTLKLLAAEFRDDVRLKRRAGQAGGSHGDTFATAFTSEDRQLMANYKIVLWPSKRMLTAVNKGAKVKLRIRFSKKRRRRYSAAKFQEYVRTKAQSALKRMVKIMAHDDGKNDDDCTSRSESVESSCVDSLDPNE